AGRRPGAALARGPPRGRLRAERGLLAGPLLLTAGRFRDRLRPRRQPRPRGVRPTRLPRGPAGAMRRPGRAGRGAGHECPILRGRFGAHGAPRDGGPSRARFLSPQPDMTLIRKNTPHWLDEVAEAVRFAGYAIVEGVLSPPF